MLPIDSGDLRGIKRGSFRKSVYEKSTQPGAFFHSIAFVYTTKNKDNGMVIDVIASISSVIVCVLCVKIEPCQPLYLVWS